MASDTAIKKGVQKFALHLKEIYSNVWLDSEKVRQDSEQER
jgi:hypothetical protein